ncbi:HAD-IA family hydrolase [Hahella sp. SMD15-11]|uniref:phosphoglycolate phosphatase n=1 Tax=Thermohahella caldifontis TaxID=3142973 RepID=A0AB39UV22_9GAMM
MGNGAAKLVERALAWALGHAPDEALLNQALAGFMDAYGASRHTDTRVFPGVIPFLESVAPHWHLAVVTNKPERFVGPILTQTGLAPYFSGIIGGDTLPVRKPDPAPLLTACKQLGVPARRAIMVGDSVTDVRAARNAGLPVIAVPYGYNHGEPVAAAGPDHLVDRLDHLTHDFLLTLLNQEALDGT